MRGIPCKKKNSPPPCEEEQDPRVHLMHERMDSLLWKRCGRGSCRSDCVRKKPAEAATFYSSTFRSLADVFPESAYATCLSCTATLGHRVVCRCFFPFFRDRIAFIPEDRPYKISIYIYMSIIYTYIYICLFIFISLFIYIYTGQAL